uniref:Kinesin motor domain-containing protein n=1 Tax=Macrostomum lignano TaxID=282301 RepID=A0A1I8HTF7_9PLAT
MNIDVIGRVRPSIRNEGPCTLAIGSDNRVSSRPGGQSFVFQHLYQQGSSNLDVYSRHVEPMVDIFLAGYNVCFMCFGESGSGKSFTLAGDSSMKNGLVPLVLASLFAKLDPGDKFLYSQDGARENSKVTLRMVEIYQEKVRDLMVIPTTSDGGLQLRHTAEGGVEVDGAIVTQVNKASEATTLFREGWTRRNEEMTDQGLASNQSAVVLQLDLTYVAKETGLPNRSRFTLVDLPGSEKLIFESTHIRMRDGPLLSRAIVAFAGVAKELSSKRNANRVINYNQSVLTRLLQEELGGNCRTRCLVCMKPQSDSDVLAGTLRVAEQLALVNTFPILNDLYAQFLLTQIRARLLKLELDLGSDVGGGQGRPAMSDVKTELQRVQTENLQLRDKSERLLYRLEQLQSKYGTLAHSKADLNSELLSTEEEKLKVGKALVELEIENNKLKEELEAQKFEMGNRILELENQLLEASMRAEQWHADAMKLRQTEDERKQLADEFVRIKEQLLTQTRDYDALVAKNEELSMELLNLVNTKNELLKQRDNMSLAGMRGAQHDPQAEMQRIKAMIAKTPAEMAAAAGGGRGSSRRQQLPAERRMLRTGELDRELEGLRGQYDKDQEKLRDRINFLLKELQDTRQLAKNRLREISEVKAALVTARSDAQQMQLQYNRCQHKLKDLQEEYKSRLGRYVQDIAEHEDSRGGGGGDGGSLRDYVTSMLADLRRAHKSREEQLAAAAQEFRGRMMDTAREHERLLVAHESLRQRVLESAPDVDPGPPIDQLRLTDEELISGTQSELLRLTEELTRARKEAANLKLRLGARPDTGERQRLADGEAHDFQDLRRQIRDFNNSALEEQLREARRKLEKQQRRPRDSQPLERPSELRWAAVDVAAAAAVKIGEIAAVRTNSLDDANKSARWCVLSHLHPVHWLPAGRPILTHRCCRRHVDDEQLQQDDKRQATTGSFHHWCGEAKQFKAMDTGL